MNWNNVSARLNKLSAGKPLGGGPENSNGLQINTGQRASLCGIGERLPRNGVIIADEVGMGKTRIAVGLARSVIDCGGRVAIVIPPGLGYQWQDELREAMITSPPILRSLWQYFAAWEPETPAEQRPWDREQVVLISHAFTNWRLGTTSQAWRWALLPEVYCRWRRSRDGRYPRAYHNNHALSDPWVNRAAQNIINVAEQGSTGSAARLQRLLDRLKDETPWPGSLDAAEYSANESLRPKLEQVVGLGLGFFDLIIVDEAHKSRHYDSALSRLLESVVQKTPSARRVAMTATPVELNAGQWKNTLGRIGIDGKEIGMVIDHFAKCVDRVRKTPSDEEARRRYYESARSFEDTLTPYLLRRDKRQDPGVVAFTNYTGESAHSYRQEQMVEVDPRDLSLAWKQTVCAAEALSVVTRGLNDHSSKRLRLTLGNGHGVAALIDQLNRDDRHDHDPDSDGEIDSVSDASPDNDDETETKRTARAHWWKRVITETLGKTGQPLLDHPAILSAVVAIEDADRKSEKVLVFGRFIRPLQDLVRLLNARALFRCLDEGRLWPQSKIIDDEWPAIQAAHLQLDRPGQLDRASLDGQLARQYRTLEQRREILRRHLMEDIGQGLQAHPDDSRVVRFFEAFKVSVETHHRPAEDQSHTLAIMARAIQELLPLSDANRDREQTALAFVELLDALSERDEGDADGDGVLDEQEAAKLWPVLEQRLIEEYNRPQGGFARLMYGGTKPETRRLLQLAFNRSHSWPRVLVSQSQVGREGLNLHTACRTVFLLHPEWNPGVVEQQIGRVDRVNSHWETSCRHAIDKGCPPEELPRIMVQPVVFRGTYDEWNWQVLRKRWDDLRSQLHGVILPPHEAEAYRGMEDTVREINQAAPNFNPTETP